jgi:hypothetical protein
MVTEETGGAIALADVQAAYAALGWRPVAGEWFRDVYVEEEHHEPGEPDERMVECGCAAGVLAAQRHYARQQAGLSNETFSDLLYDQLHTLPVLLGVSGDYLDGYTAGFDGEAYSARMWKDDAERRRGWHDGQAHRTALAPLRLTDDDRFVPDDTAERDDAEEED